MPYAALRPCTYPGCTILVRRGRCDEHRQAEISHHYPERQRLYDRRWRKRRRAWLAEHPWCEECLRANIFTPAVDVHHLERHEGDIEKFLTGPFESECHACHSKKTHEEIHATQAAR